MVDAEGRLTAARFELREPGLAVRAIMRSPRALPAHGCELTVADITQLDSLGEVRLGTTTLEQVLQTLAARTPR